MTQVEGHFFIGTLGSVGPLISNHGLFGKLRSGKSLPDGVQSCADIARSTFADSVVPDLNVFPAAAVVRKRGDRE